jgi:MFS family permease
MAWPRPLRSLRHRNLRLFFAGQAVSLAGTWMQSVAQSWLVWRLTHSPWMLGVVGFLGQVPFFVLSLWAGSLADRFPRRKVVLATQTVAIVQAVLLAGVTLAGVVRPWMIVALAALLGVASAFEVPARQALLADVAGEDYANAIALNSSVFNAARVVGPALAGALVAALGEGVCFALNAVSFVGTYRALMVMEIPPRDPPPPHAGHRAHLLEGIAYAGRNAHVLWLLALLCVSSLFAVPYQTLLPALAAGRLGGGASLYGALLGCAGVGALAGAVSLLARTGLRGLGRRVAVGTSCLGAAALGLGLSSRPLLSAAALALAGFGMITQAAGTMTLLQGFAPDAMRGRVVGLFTTLFHGTAPFGALAAGLAAQRFGPAPTIAVGGTVLLAASAAFHLALPRLRKTVLAQHPTLFPPAAS